MGDPTRVLLHLPEADRDAVAVHTSVVKGLVSLQRLRWETPEAAEFDQELPTKLVERFEDVRRAASGVAPVEPIVFELSAKKKPSVFCTNWLRGASE